MLCHGNLVCFMSAYFNKEKTVAYNFINVRKKIQAISNQSGVVLMLCVKNRYMTYDVCHERIVGIGFGE